LFDIISEKKSFRRRREEKSTKELYAEKRDTDMYCPTKTE
jgi:hypothetical protein